MRVGENVSSTKLVMIRTKDVKLHYTTPHPVLAGGRGLPLDHSNKGKNLLANDR